MLTISKDKLLAVGRTAEVYEWGQGQILKLFFDWYPLSNVEHEANISRLIYETGLPVPEFGDVQVFGERLGVVYERIDGITMDMQLRAEPWSVFKLADLLAGLQDDIHTRLAPELPSYHKLLARRIRREEALPEDWKSFLLQQLDQLPEGEQLCHADLHPQNIILSDKGPVVIDWADAVQGNPLADLARTSIIMEKSLAPGRQRIPMVERLLRGLFSIRHRRKYGRLNEFDQSEYSIWKIIIAAARLAENVPEEKQMLLETVRYGMDDMGF